MDGGLGVQREQSAPSVPERSVNAHRMGGRSASEGLPRSDRVLFPQEFPRCEGRGNEFWNPAAARHAHK
jgi:hypothetical protein